MFETAGQAVPDYEPGRWRISTRHEGQAWEINVEPDLTEQLLVVITAYPVWSLA